MMLVSTRRFLRIPPLFSSAQFTLPSKLSLFTFIISSTLAAVLSPKVCKKNTLHTLTVSTDSFGAGKEYARVNFLGFGIAVLDWGFCIFVGFSAMYLESHCRASP